jgi:hypothetical protein
LVVFKETWESVQAYNIIRMNLDKVRVYYVTPKGAAVFRGIDPARISRFADELLVVVHLRGNTSARVDIYRQVFIEMTSLFGSVKAFERINDIGGGMAFRLEFDNTTSTEKALKSRMDIGFSFGISINVSPYAPDLLGLPQSSQLVGPTYSAPQASLTGRSMLPSSVASTSTPYGQLLQPGPFFRRGRNDNRINVSAILSGEDIRTTVMLRNIPNRVDIHLLKSIIDETSAGKYDFVYLRIDFQNQCNVGYAFINFSDALSIVPFAHARQGVRWTIYDSDKTSEISYASELSLFLFMTTLTIITAIQDRANLIQKFRNSSVMLEHPDYRPKVSNILLFP